MSLAITHIIPRLSVHQWVLRLFIPVSQVFCSGIPIFLIKQAILKRSGVSGEANLPGPSFTGKFTLSHYYGLT